MWSPPHPFVGIIHSIRHTRRLEAQSMIVLLLSFVRPLRSFSCCQIHRIGETQHPPILPIHNLQFKEMDANQMKKAQKPPPNHLSPRNRAQKGETHSATPMFEPRVCAIPIIDSTRLHDDGGIPGTYWMLSPLARIGKLQLVQVGNVTMPVRIILVQFMCIPV